MTFLDAAIEILRRADGPMHFGEIARQAVDQNLLSHVGRDPEAAMRSCLNSAVRAGREGGDSLIVRSKPGHYGLRPGAKLPEPPPAPEAKAAELEAAESGAGEKAGAQETPEPEAAQAEAPKLEAAPGSGTAEPGTLTDSGAKEAAPVEAETEAESTPGKVSKHRTRKTARASARRGTGAAGTEEAGARKRRRRERTPARGEAPRPESVEILPSRKETDPEAAKIKPVEFEAPSGSGLEGVTDVELVMANAMSRLAEERPELREELEAMQQTQSSPVVEQRARGDAPPASREDSGAQEERQGRRKRRRRRRARRVDWSGAARGARSASSSLTDKLLESVAGALDEAGPRSLHVRQIAEALANKGILGGEISEIERAVTSALLLDIHTHGRTSRFTARGDARYQLQGTRLPEPAAKAEQAVREAVRTLEAETGSQLVQWLQTLGARALESLVRVYLQREGYSLVATLPPNRGLGKLVVEEREPEEDEGRVLVLVVPKRTSLEPRLWDGELERNKCTTMTVFTMGEAPDEAALGDVRCVQASELAGWLREQGLGVERVCFEVSVLDPTLIESIGGLDT